MDGAPVGGRRKGQAYGLAAGSEALVLLGDYADSAFPRMGDDGYCYWNDNQEVQEG